MTLPDDIHTDREWLTWLRPHRDRVLAPASDLRTVNAARVVLGSAAVAWAVEVAGRVAGEHLRAGRLPADSFHEGRAGCEAGLLHGLTQFALDQPAEVIGASERALQDARHWARQDRPIDLLVRILWSTHSMVNDAVLDELPEGDPSYAKDQIRRIVADLTTYVGNTVRDMVDAYERERAAWTASESVARARALSTVLAGEDDPELESALGLRLRGYHLAAVAWPTTTMPDDERARELERICAKLSSNLGASGCAVIPLAQHDVLWLTFHRSESVDVAGVVESVEGLGLAFGSVERDVDGLRTTYRHAVHTSRVGRLTGKSGCWTYDSVSMVALALNDIDATRSFVVSELDGVLGTDVRQRELRDTVRVFLAAGRSRQEAARALNIAPTTVAYRVQRFEELRGRPLAPRQLQTALALEIVHHAAEALAGPPSE